MTTVRVYYAGIPAKNTNKEKELVLHHFHKGIPAGISKEVKSPTWEPSDLAVMQGWVHANSGKTPHLMFRREIINRQQQIGKHTLAIDSNLFLYKDPNNTKTYLRFSLNDIFPIKGNYFTDKVDPLRWQKISKDIGIELQPWRNNGNHILICLQRNGGWSMKNLDVMQWLHSTIQRIRKYSDRPIVVRGHPGDKRVKEYLKLSMPNVRISAQPSVLNDFINCWAVVTYNSSPGVAAAIEGRPVFVTDPEPKYSQAYEVCNTNLADIENPRMPDRQQWIEKLAMCHFNFDDLQKGIAWNIIKDYL